MLSHIVTLTFDFLTMNFYSTSAIMHLNFTASVAAAASVTCQSERS